MALRLRGAVAARLGLGGLHEAVDALDEAISDLRCEPSEDAVAVTHDRARCVLHRLETRADGPAVPAIEDELAPTGGRLVVDILEGKPEPVGARGFEMHAGERSEARALLGGEMPFVLEPEIATALELWSILALGAPHLVDGVVDELDGVEFVEGDLGFGEVVADGLDEWPAHV